MTNLKSKNSCPPNGFRFEEKATGFKSWEANPQSLWDYRALLSEVQRHRMANPRYKLSADINVIDAEVEQQNVARIQAIPGAESYLVRSGGSEGGNAVALPKSPAPVAAIVAAAKKLNAGHKLLSEWKESGYNPVADKEAERRAAICATCPQNQPGGFERFFTIPFSEKIKADIEEFKSRNLMTSFDEKLQICEICMCPLKLKIWCELDLILKHSTPETLAALPPECWIKTKSE